MRSDLIIFLGVFILFFLIATPRVQAQFNTVNYVSNGYFNGLNLEDSLMIQDTAIITISQNSVEILLIDLKDSSKDKVLIKRRCLSPIKYPTIDGGYYYVWKLGDRKMILRTINDAKYLSLYQTDEFGLPKQYLTFKIKEEVDNY